MKKAALALALAAMLSLGAFAVGCDGTAGGTENGSESGGTDMEQGGSTDSGQEPEERTLRVLPAEHRYEVRTEELSIDYDDITLYGKLWEPTEEGKYPLVVMSHGFNGHYSDFSAEAQRLAERGYVAYGFDFCGAQKNGRSTGRTADEYTPFTMKRDLIEAINVLKRFPEVDKTQIFLLGGSQGGLVTALAAAELKEEISAIALYFPAFNIPHDWSGRDEVTTPLMGYSIGAEYIRSVQNFDPYTVIGDFKKDVCILWGDKDNIVAREYIERAVATYGEDRTEYKEIPGAGHGFVGDDIKTATETVLAFFEARTYECI